MLAVPSLVSGKFHRSEGKGGRGGKVGRTRGKKWAGCGKKKFTAFQRRKVDQQAGRTIEKKGADGGQEELKGGRRGQTYPEEEEKKTSYLGGEFKKNARRWPIPEARGRQERNKEGRVRKNGVGEEP